MQISKVIKTDEGTVKFEGEITQEEHEFVLTVGLHTLIQQGALPFIVAEEEELSSFVPGTDNVQ